MVKSVALHIPFMDLKAQYRTIKSEVDEAIDAVIDSASFILGSAVQEFEEDFAAYCGVNYAVGVDSGTSALELILRAYDIGLQDEVITVSNTFIASILAISNAGATPILVDIDPHTYNIDPNTVEAAITPKTKAIMPIHLYGQPANMDALVSIAQKHNLILIEDACQAHGATIGNQKVGSIGNAAAFSFYPAKNLGAYGDAGMAVTNDAKIAEKLMQLRNYGQSKKYHHDVVGYNRRMDTMQAAILKVKLPYLDQWNAARRDHARLYTELLANANVVTPHVTIDGVPVWHLYVIRAKDRDGLQEHLSASDISTGIHYPVPAHLQPAYHFLGHKPGDFPITERYANQILSLPMYPELTPTAIEYVAAQVKRFSI